MHQLVLRKSLTLELPHVEKIHFFTLPLPLSYLWVTPKSNESKIKVKNGIQLMQFLDLHWL